MRFVLIDVFVFVSFFVLFLVTELLSILYFTKANDDLGLRRLARKKSNLDWQNMPLTLTCSN